jgi:kumamolisin
MSSPEKRLALAGSERSPMRGAREVGPANPNEQMEVTIRLCSRAGKTAAISDEALARPAQQRPILTREQLELSHGANPADITRVESFARQHGLAVTESSAARRTVIVSGTVSAMSQAFGVVLHEYEHPGGRYRGRTGAVNIPVDLQNVIEGIFGLDNRPQAKPHFRRRRVQPGIHAQAVNLSYTPLQVASFYKFPTGVDGAGECIGIIELGGGSKPADLSSYFTQLGLAKQPNVSSVAIGKGKNNPTGDPGGPDGEVMLDIEIAGAVAPGAKIVVYFAENTDAGFLNAITTAVHDKTNKPSILSISWGGPESAWTTQAMTSMDEAFQSAAALGVSICVASGDDGATDGVTDGNDHVDFPASSPFVLGCGGTKLVASGNTISNETVWNELPNEGATGGGVSTFFPLPTWQQGFGVPSPANSGGGRGVPDVSGDADPATGYVTRVDGQPDVIGGTSAVAPLWAGLLALINQQLGTPVGFVNPLLYQIGNSGGGFRDIVTGNNGSFSAKKGWDACTGLGSPVGTGILQGLTGTPLAKTGT